MSVGDPQQRFLTLLTDNSKLPKLLKRKIIKKRKNYPNEKAIEEEMDNQWEDIMDEFLSKNHGKEISLLLKTFQNYKKRKINVDKLIFESDAVINYTWEKLNVGKWMNVPEERKQVYTIASFIKIIGVLNKKESDFLSKCLEITDMGILLGCPFRKLSFTKIADILSLNIRKKCSTFENFIKKEPPLSPLKHSKILKLDNEIETIVCPSVEYFRDNYFIKNRPVKLKDCISHWPALKLWKDLKYIIKKCGHRIVPIELGKHYADESYSQKLMKVSDFIQDFFWNNSNKIGYLAQHQLFDQVPELKKDILTPDYCVLSLNSEPTETVEINAWFGPRDTISPLHFDPKHNLLCQIVGSKKITLYSQKYSEYLYPHKNSILFNTSEIDVENPDLIRFPNFSKTIKEECFLNSGEILYIPPKYWHHVRSLENSFSVSFWWE